jgi:hypothetical protein
MNYVKRANKTPDFDKFLFKLFFAEVVLLMCDGWKKKLFALFLNSIMN